MCQCWLWHLSGGGESHFNLLGPVCYHYRPYKLLYEILIFLSCSQSFTWDVHPKRTKNAWTGKLPKLNSIQTRSSLNLWFLSIFNLSCCASGLQPEHSFWSIVEPIIGYLWANLGLSWSNEKDSGDFFSRKHQIQILIFRLSTIQPDVWL